jgi:2-oxoglutarate dehydrogenase E1 component
LADRLADVLYFSYSTPANYFHVLRRQVRRDFRKPLILFFSKSLLRHPEARSHLSEMTGDTIFQRYLPEPHPENMVPPEEVRRHILCTGQVYYTLIKEREARGINDVAISRLEQISPFPYELVRAIPMPYAGWFCVDH